MCKISYKDSETFISWVMNQSVVENLGSGKCEHSLENEVENSV